MSIDPRKLRDALGSFATGVTVVTARALAGELIGITANSFTSVSLDPPLVLFSLDRRAYSLRRFEECGRFAVNILDQSQRDVSTTFATPLADKFATVRYHFGRTGSPVLEDAIAVFDCSVRFRYDGGDHVIFVGEVVDLVVKTDGKPLLYFRSHYRELSELSSD
jgi:flavin reductase (DIM6/NTAB) family NADH-FMN oxidoreductase RutF